MAKNFNQIIVEGTVGSDITEKFFNSGKAVYQFSLANNTQKGQNEITTWYQVDVWGENMAWVKQALSKGSGVIIIGEHRIDKWTDNSGYEKQRNTINALRIIPKGSSNRGTQNNAGGGQSNGNRQASTPTPNPWETNSRTRNSDDFEDDIPF